MVQIKCFINGLYSLNNSNIPFGMGFQPLPPLKEEFRLNITFLRLRFPLNFVIYRRSLIKMFDIIGRKHLLHEPPGACYKYSLHTELSHA